MKKFAYIILILGILLVCVAALITPSFVTRHLTSQNNVTQDLIHQIQLTRILSTSVGLLFIILGLSIVTASKKIFSVFSNSSSIFSRKGFYIAFCILCFVVTLLLGLKITQSGSGLSPDSEVYISVASHLYEGKGFLYDTHSSIGDHPYTVGGPLYPVLIAAFMHLGFDGEGAARIVPVLCFALLMFPLFFLGKAANDTFTGCVTCISCLVFPWLLYLASWSWTEMPYVLFSVLAILFLTLFIKNEKAKNTLLVLSGIFAACAFLTRYVGVTLFAIGFLVIVIKFRFQVKKSVTPVLVFLLSAGIPAIPWIIRNLVITSALQGDSYPPSHVGFLENVGLTFKLILSKYFVNSLSHLYTHYYIGLILIAAAVILLIIYIQRHSKTEKVWLIFVKNHLAVILYIFVYLFAIILIRTFAFHGVEAREAAPAYPLITLLGVSFISYSYKELGYPAIQRIFSIMAAIFFLVFLTYQVDASLAYISNAKNGQGYNDAGWRNFKSIPWAKANITGNAIVYSDMADVMGLRLTVPVRYLPISQNPEEVELFFKEISTEENAYIFRFNGGQRDNRLSNTEIRNYNEKLHIFTTIADFPEAVIWQTLKTGNSSP